MSGRTLLLGLAFALLPASKPYAAETCRFSGTTDYDGHVAVTTNAMTTANTVRIAVTLRFEATTTLWLHLRYLVEEISEWRRGTLHRLDVNTRYVFAGHVVRQEWDDFQLSGDGLQAHRIEGKRAPQFHRQFPRFAQHWDLAAFGMPWLNDYAAAAPVRRPDLDLGRPLQSAATQAPFALAFYWVRFLHPAGQHAQVFLPGFKADKLADLAIAPETAPIGHILRADLHHSYLSASPPSTATAEIAPDGHLQRLAFILHGSAGSASGHLDQGGCTGTAAP